MNIDFYIAAGEALRWVGFILALTALISLAGCLWLRRLVAEADRLGDECDRRNHPDCTPSSS